MDNRIKLLEILKDTVIEHARECGICRESDILCERGDELVDEVREAGVKTPRDEGPNNQLGHTPN